MVDEVYRDIFRIDVVLPGNPLKATNAYFIKGDESDLLIDTGFRRKECYDALEEGLRILGSDLKRRSVLCTHLHADHSGLADQFAGPRQKIYMGAVDQKYRTIIYDPVRREVKRKRYLDEGFPRETLDLIYSTTPAVKQAMPGDTKMEALRGGDRIKVGNYTLHTVLVPGHTPGNCMFWIEEEGVMFTGDHILFDITPNITEWDGMPDSLGCYIDSLRDVRNYPVKRALPGHRKEGDYRARIDEIIDHHERRLTDTVSVIEEHPGITGYEIAGLMRWKIKARNWDEFPATQKWFAVGECYSHLDYLVRRGRIRREEKNGQIVYFSN